jgi:MFS family permease
VTDSAAAQPIPLSEANLRRVLATLCLTQITSWGVLFYAFTVLSVRVTQQAGWSPFAVTAAFSAALVTSALAGIVVGRWIDRHGPHAVMTAGSVLGPSPWQGWRSRPHSDGSSSPGSPPVWRWARCCINRRLRR